MTLPAPLWEQVRQRANGACEYCSVTETDSGGPLTVDHLLEQYREVVTALEHLQRQHTLLLQEQRDLLEEQRALLRSLLQREK